jgi:hypothetical protein
LCWFYKKRKLPKLKLDIEVINNDGGVSDETQWIIHANANAPPKQRNFQCIPDLKNTFHRVKANVPYQLSCEYVSATEESQYREHGWSCSDGGKMIDDTTIKLKWGTKVVFCG